MKLIEINGKNECVATIVDDEDYLFLLQFNWYETKKGYIRGYRRGINRRSQKMIQMHRLIMNAPDTKQVDHRNHIAHDNQKTNLRIVTPSQNQLNRVNTNKTSKYKGVRIKSDGLIEGYFMGKYLGLFETEEQAAIAYDSCSTDYDPEHCRTNLMMELYDD